MNAYKKIISRSLDLISFLLLSASAVSPVLSEIGAAYPDVPGTIVALMTTLPTLVAIPTTLITGRVLGSKLKYRTAIIWGIILNLVGGLMPIVTESFSLLLFWRAIFGLGTGIIMPVTVPILMAVFQGREIDAQASRNAISTNIGAVIFQMLGGVLCSSIGWRGTFLIYLIFLPSLIIICISMPEPQENKMTSDEPFISVIKGIKPALKWCLLYMVHMLFFYVAVTEMSQVVVDSHFGDSSIAGTALSVITVGGIFGGVAYRWLCCFEAKTFAIAYAFLAAGYLIMQLSPTGIILILGAFIVGVGFGIHMPAIQVFVGKDSATDKRSEAAAVSNVFASIGSFSSNFMITWIVTLLGKEPGKASFGICVIGYSLMVALVLLVSVMTEKGKFNFSTGEEES